MPIYEYRCPKCETVFEKVQKFSADTVHACVQCGYEAAERIMSMTSFHLKGGGWYKDGYSSSPKSSAKSGSDSSSSSSSESSSSGCSSGACGAE